MIVRALAAGLALALASSTAVPARDEIRDLSWHLDALRIDEVHQISTGAGITVGVIDTGADATHPDLANSVLPGRDFSGATTGTGTQDIDGHGTSMSGLIVAHGRATGIAPGARVLPVRTQTVGDFDNGRTPEAVDWAVDQGAKVLCIASSGSNDRLLAAAISRAIERDVVVVAGIGNTNRPSGGYPAAYPGVVAAVGTDKEAQHASISVAAPYAVLAAPATDIPSTFPSAVSSTGYKLGSGSSIAAAIIAGVAALVRSKYPNLSATEVIHRMTATADDKGTPGRDDQFGYGIVNPVKALTADVPPLPPSPDATATDAAPPPANRDNPVLIIAGLVGIAAFIALLVVLTRRRTRSQ